MIRIQRASLVGVVTLVLVSVAGSVAATGGGGGGTRVLGRSLPAADAAPSTTAVGAAVGPTTALPNLPTVPTVAAPPTAPPPTVPPPTVPLPTAAGTTVAPFTYVPVEDEYGMLTVELPTLWSEVDTRPFVNDDGTMRPGISASTDLEAFDDQWDTPGMVFTAYRFQPDPNVLFGQYDYSNQCTDAGTTPYNDQVFVGYLRTFSQCAAVRSTNYVIVANAPGNQVTIVVVVQTVTPADEVAYQHILDTFNVDPNVSMPTETVPPDTTTTPALPTTPLPTVPLPTTPSPTSPVPTVAPPTVLPATVVPATVPPATVPVPTVPAPTVPAPPVLPTSPLLTTPATVPVVTPPGTTGTGVPAGYQVVTDDTGRLSVQVPSTWTDIDGAPGLEGGIDVAAVSAAPNLTTFRETFDGPGLLLHETAFQADPTAELACRGLAGTCTAGPVLPNPNPAFSGVYQSWLDCGGTTTDWHVLVANPVDGRQTTVVMVVQTMTAADEEALKVAFSSYRLNTTV